MKSTHLLILTLTLAITGCVTGTRNISLNVPDYGNEETASGSVHINIINDKRSFEQKPRNPSTPSVKGTLEGTSSDKLATLIGRQRNSYGKAMGDVALVEGVTVQDRVLELMTTGLKSRGYTVVEDTNADNNVTVDIEKFWAWFSPGMFSVSFEADLLCKVQFQNKSGNVSLDVKGYGMNKGQVASDANWELTYQRAFTDFLNKLDESLDAKGL